MVILGFDPTVSLRGFQKKHREKYREFAIATGIAGQIIPMQDAIAKHRTTLASQDSNV